MVDISSTRFLGDFVDRNSFPMSTILFVNWTLLVKYTLNRPSFAGFYPNLFFWSDLIATFLQVHYFWG